MQVNREQTSRKWFACCSNQGAATRFCTLVAALSENKNWALGGSNPLPEVSMEQQSVYALAGAESTPSIRAPQEICAQR